MNRSRIMTIALSLTVGLLLGFTASSLAFRQRWLRNPGEQVVERMDRLLKLTPAEREQVMEIVQDSRDRVEQARRDFQRERRQQTHAARVQIRGILDPQQQAEFDRNFKPRERPKTERAQPVPE